MAAPMGAAAAASFLSDAYGEEGKEQNSAGKEETDDKQPATSDNLNPNTEK